MRESSGGAEAGRPAEVDAALQKFRDVLAADGYQLDWSLSPAGQVTITILAGPDACADCLVPLPVMEAIMADALGPTQYALGHIELPAHA